MRPAPSPFWLRPPSAGSPVAEPSRPRLNCLVSSRLSCAYATHASPVSAALARPPALQRARLPSAGAGHKPASRDEAGCAQGGPRRPGAAAAGCRRAGADAAAMRGRASRKRALSRVHMSMRPTMSVDDTPSVRLIMRKRPCAGARRRVAAQAPCDSTSRRRHTGASAAPPTSRAPPAAPISPTYKPNYTLP